MKKFTQQEIDNWNKYEKVRQSGEYNMFDLRAQTSTDLTYEEYMFVMKNYTELAEADKFLPGETK